MKKLLISGIFIFIVSLTTKAQNNIIICKDGSEISGKGLFTIVGDDLNQHDGTQKGGMMLVTVKGNDIYLNGKGMGQDLIKAFSYEKDVIYTFDENYNKIPYLIFNKNHVKIYNGTIEGGKGLCTINGNNIMTYNGSYNGGSCMASMENPISKQMQSAVMIGFLIYGQSKTYNGIFNFN